MTIKIPTDTIKKDFLDFISTEHNSRILFSGKFGVGKTHFINSFFEENEESYDVFHLYPINYQINNNEDIVSLIKYDILIELLNKEKENEQILFKNNSVEDFKENSLFFMSWLTDNYSTNDILKKALEYGEDFFSLPIPFLNSFSKLGRPLKDLLVLDKKFQSFKEEYIKGEKGIVENYIKEIQAKNISETDYISFLIKEKIKLNKGERKSVLVLDDLDRVDPEHIFRLLNIFSSFFEREDENKFGFDTIIVVADRSNLKSIFHHKYGEKTNFSGYLNKFFSIFPYYFDNKKAVINTIEDIVNNIKNEEPILTKGINKYGYINIFLKHIFINAIKLDLVNLRELLKATKYQFNDLKKGAFYNDTSHRDDFKRYFNIALNIAILSFANVDDFLDIIKKIKENSSQKLDENFNDFISFMIKDLRLKLNGKSFYYGDKDKYLINWDISDDSFVNVQNGTKEDLFYDLLIEYINKKTRLI